MELIHEYTTHLIWTGNIGNGTAGYKSYDRSFEVRIENKDSIYGSSDPAFMGDRKKSNPEELLLASVSSCHMLWYLHLCAVNEVIVTKYADSAYGALNRQSNGRGSFSSIQLSPLVHVAEEIMINKAEELHAQANTMCFIANSLNININHHAEIRTESI